MSDRQLLHHLWWLKQHLNNYMGDDYAELMENDYILAPDIKTEVDALVAHIKLNY
jgi:hypothetical protein